MVTKNCQLETLPQVVPKHWPAVPLGEILSPVSRPETVDAEKSYRILGAHWYAQGLYIKDVTTGAGVRAHTLYRVESGDFVYNRLFAWKGSFALATQENHGCYASNEFPCFTVNPSKLDGKFLWLYFSRQTAWDEALALSTGGTPTSRNRLKEDKFLGLRIPLPPLQEQRRIVARIEALAAKIEEARNLRDGAIKEATSLLRITVESMLESNMWPARPLGTILRENSLNGLSARPSNAPPGIPILRISAATSSPDAVVDEHDFKYLDVSGEEARKYALQPGDLLACRFNGNLHFVGRFAIYKRQIGETHLYPDKLIRFRVDDQKALPRFVCVAMNSLGVRKTIESMAATTAGNIGISATNLKTVTLPIPPLRKQHQIVDDLRNLQTRVGVVKRLQAETAAELDALFPSILDKAFKGEL